MKAVFIVQHGGPEKLTFGDWPEPEAAQGEVMRRISASAQTKKSDRPTEDRVLRSGIREGEKTELLSHSNRVNHSDSATELLDIIRLKNPPEA